MSRLIVLSNRVKLPCHDPMAGGLAVALHNLLLCSSGIWMGWDGIILDTKGGKDSTNNSDLEFANNDFNSTYSKSPANTTDQTADSKITYLTTALTTSQYQQFYCGFANNVLWPLLHERSDLIYQAPKDYSGYQAVNLLFARQLKQVMQPDDVLWVHDYHFLSVAYHCRQLGMRNRIGFFLHIPFAPLAFWQQLKQSAELIKHLAHYDVLGVQTYRDKANSSLVFAHYLKDYLISDDYRQEKGAIDYKVINRLKNSQPQAVTTQANSAKTSRSAPLSLLLTIDSKSAAPHLLAINAYPIGVNVAKIQQQVSHLLSQTPCHSSNPIQKNNAIKSAAQQIIAVDRIDYSKGLLKRFSAYQSFLQQYPLYQNQLKLLQIACPSRLSLPVYQRLYDEVRQTVNEVNQQFIPSACAADSFIANDLKADAVEASHVETNHTGNPWQPITYNESVLSHAALMTVFSQSDVGWVNSLKDGMNLVAKEYIAAQNPDNPGVLLLSRYAGAAEQMRAAVIIDPQQPKSIIDGLRTALTMPLAERKTRYQLLLQGLQQDDLHSWQQRFLEDLYGQKQPIMRSQRFATEPLTDLPPLSYKHT